MSDQLANTILPFLAWNLVPVATNYLQALYYNATIRVGNPKPAPGSPAHVKHRRRIYAVVVIAYLLYSLYEAHWTVRRRGDFYADLGVEHDVDDKALQTKFRRLTLVHHPDKVANSHQRAAAEAYYVHLKLARDTLLNPAKRFAYDRFGPDVTAWQHCVSLQDFVLQMVKTSAPYYVGSGVVLVVLGWFGWFDSGEYWRYLTFITLATFELRTLIRPSFPLLCQLPSVLDPANYLSTSLRQRFSMHPQAPYLPFQTLQVAHKAVITIFIASARLRQLLQQSGLASTPLVGVDEKVQLERQLLRLEQMVALNALESSRLLQLELAPFQDAEEVNNQDQKVGGVGQKSAGTRLLRDKIKDWLVTNTIRSDREVQAAVARVIDKRKAESCSLDDTVLLAK